MTDSMDALMRRSSGIDFNKIGYQMVYDQHRTHQQTIIRNLVNMLEGACQELVDEQGSDDRNRAAKEFSELFLQWKHDIGPKGYFPYI